MSPRFSGVVAVLDIIFQHLCVSISTEEIDTLKGIIIVIPSLKYD